MTGCHRLFFSIALSLPAITRAEYTISQKQLRLEAVSTNSAGTLTVYDLSTGAFMGTMTFSGGGKFQLQILWPVTP